MIKTKLIIFIQSINKKLMNYNKYKNKQNILHLNNIYKYVV